MECKLISRRKRSIELVTIAGEEETQTNKLCYLVSIIHNNREIEKNVAHTLKQASLNGEMH